MECEVHWIGCQLLDISEKIGQPTGWEIAGVIVSGLAAVGTVAVAVANLYLIRKQHVLSAELAQTDARRRRGEYASRLGDELGSMMSARIAGLDWKLSDRNAQWQDLNALGAATGEKTWTDYTACVTNMVIHGKITPTDPESFFTIQEAVHERYKSWVQDPSSTDFSLPDQIQAIRDSGSELKFWYK